MIAQSSMLELGGHHYMEQLVDVISYMHSNNIAHKNLKVENMLIDTNLNLKLTDFGYAKFHNSAPLCQSDKNRSIYTAPEMLDESKIYDGRKANIYSLGIILFILV